MEVIYFIGFFIKMMKNEFFKIQERIYIKEIVVIKLGGYGQKFVEIELYLQVED